MPDTQNEIVIEVAFNRGILQATGLSSEAELVDQLEHIVIRGLRRSSRDKARREAQEQQANVRDQVQVRRNTKS